MKLTIREVADKDIYKIKQLAADASEHGHLLVQRAIDDWASKVNVFDMSGEALLGVFENEKCIAICGLNIDPYAPGCTTGRLRRLYVLPGHQRKGIGKALVQTVLKHAKPYYEKGRLYTDNQQAARFYESIGFVRIDEDKATHSIKIID